jgi:hypothetical protein
MVVNKVRSTSELITVCPLAPSLSTQVIGVVWTEGQPIKTSSKMGNLYQFSSPSNSIAPPL